MRWFVFILGLMFPIAAVAQVPATLVADRVDVTANGQLLASGNIEAFFEGTRLTAQSIRYDRATDRLTITGPILITTADGAILTATKADLDPRFENGLLMGARLVLDRQLQLAANQISRRDGRYSELYKAAVTSCQVCQGQSPLWEIRARSVVHDSVEKQLYFEGAQFLIRGVPLVYIPRLRLPDPTLDRSTGLLLPQLRTTDTLGIGIKLPYFITLGDHRDLTLTPYLSAKTKTLEFRYRQAFATGDIQVNGAATQDSLYSGTRSYLFANGKFAIAGGYDLTFDVEATSDPDYLRSYGYSDKDRLDSSIALTRIEQDAFSQASLTYYQTLRDDEDNASLPPLVGDVRYERRIDLGANGVLDFGASADLAYRYSTTNGQLGRDVGRIGAFADWQQNWLIGGSLITAEAGLRADYYQINDDTGYARSGVRTLPHFRARIEYPLAATTVSGTQHLITPTVALSWSDAYGFSPPNEDSTRNELDLVSLFRTNRFTGEDAQQTGLHLAAGVEWTRIGAEGITSTLGFGRVFEQNPDAGFSRTSGLDGSKSDWALAGQITLPSGSYLMAQTRFDDQAEITHAEALASWQNDMLSLNAAYIWQPADSAELRTDDLSEVSLDTTVQVNDHWAVSLDTRYDLANGQPARAGIGFEYTNECVIVGLSASRRYDLSSLVEPETSYGLTVELTGFSTGGGVPARSGCGG